MTPEPPPTPLRHPRPGVAARRQALGLDGAGPARESLTEALARIPDLTDPPSVPAASPVAREAVPAAPEVESPVEGVPVPAGVPDAPRTRSRPATVPWWRRVAFAVVLVGLVASIPVLGYLGYEAISESTDGQFQGPARSPSDPGYEAQVDPTPTALAIQFDEEGLPNALTFLALSGTEGGGSVIFVPLNTEVSEPVYGVGSLRSAYGLVADRPLLGRERLASQVGRLLNVGIDEIIDLGDGGWSQLVAPVAPLEIVSPDTVTLADGTTIATGPTSLTADQTGAYLAAQNDGESDLNRLNRHEVVWSAWLEQVAESGRSDAVPGESTAGIGRFASELAKGEVTYTTLPVDIIDVDRDLFRIDEPAVNDLVVNSVAAPTPAVPGSRFTVRLLNGVSADPVPSELLRQLVGLGGAVTILGNGPQFDTEETTIVYADRRDEDLATLIAASLGATGPVRLEVEAPDTVDLTIVLGKDILGDAPDASGGN